MNSINFREAAVLGMQGIPGRNSSTILVAMGSGVRSIRIGPYGDATLLFESQGLNLVGAFSSKGHLLAWTRDGEILDLNAVAGFTSFGFAPHPREIATTPIQEYSHAVLVAGQVLALHGAYVRSLSSGSRLLPGLEVASLSAVDRTSFLVRTVSGEYRLYSQTLSGSLRLSATYEVRPWFDSSVQSGPWIVTLADDHNSARILKKGGQCTL